MSSQDSWRTDVGSGVVPTETGPGKQNTIRRLRDDNGVENRSITPLTSNSYEKETDTPLLGNGCCMKVKSKFKGRHSCLCSSKAALIILFWNFIIALGLVNFLDPTIIYTSFGGSESTVNLPSVGIYYGFNAFLFLFYPLAGYLADIRWGRHKTVINDLCFIMWTLVLVTVFAGLRSYSCHQQLAYFPNPASNYCLCCTLCCLWYSGCLWSYTFLL
jgi:hypothetical protein